MMTLKDLCIIDVASCGRETTIEEAARLMRQRHTGDLVVVDNSDGTPEPVGILTDRDIVVQVVAQQRDPRSTPVSAIMASPVVVASISEDPETALERMRTHGVRRLPVVDSAGVLFGILTLDDFQRLHAEQAAQMATIVTKEQHRESRNRR